MSKRQNPAMRPPPNPASKAVRLDRAREILQAELTAEELPSPRELPTCIRPMTPVASWGRTQVKHAQLEGLERAYAWYLLIRCSGNESKYETTLRKLHELPRGGDLIAYLLRLILPLPVHSPLDGGRNANRYAEWATAVRYLARKKIAPGEVVTFGMRKGEGISAWAKRQRLWRKKQTEAEQ